jgi:hypothetical protein
MFEGTQHPYLKASAGIIDIKSPGNSSKVTKSSIDESKADDIGNANATIK